MEFRLLHLTIRNAKDLKDVKHFSKMDPYIIVTISNDQCTMQKTPVHNNGGTNPAWEFPMHFNVDENSLMQNNAALHFNIKEYGKLRDKDIGQVIVPLKELFDSKAYNVNKDVSYGVRTMSGKAKGMLNFSFKFGDKFSAFDKAVAGAYPPHANTHVEASKSRQLVMANPPGPPARGVYGGYPAQQAGYLHPPPGPGGPYGYLPPPPMQPYQQPGYGYPGRQPGYGHPGGKVKPTKSGRMARFGLKLGAGLLGGTLLGEAGDFGGLDVVGDFGGLDDAAAYADGYSDVAGDFGGLDDAAAYADGYSDVAGDFGGLDDAAAYADGYSDVAGDFGGLDDAAAYADGYSDSVGDFGGDFDF